MAGWLCWDDLQVSAGTSVARTVLGTVVPDIRRVARAHRWEEGVWPDRLLAAMSEVIVSAKSLESYHLREDESLKSAVRAGEMFASARFHEDVERFVTSEEAQVWLIRFVREHPPAGRAPSPAVANRIRANNRIANLLPNDNGVRPGWAAVTFDTYVEWLYVSREEDDSNTVVCNALVAYVCGLCKMGNMSNDWLRKRLPQIRRDAQNPDVELEKATMQKVWDFYGVAFHPRPADFGPFFVWLEGKCRGKAMNRLFITAQQSAKQGCTVLTMIADAQRLCDDFHWERFYAGRTPAEAQIGREMEIWNEDYAALMDNPWIRFGGTVGRSPEMANLGYLCKSLLSRGIGQSSVDNYQGLELGNLTIRHRAWIDRVVQQYVEAVARGGGLDDNTPVMRPREVGRRRLQALGHVERRPDPADFELNAPENPGAGRGQPMAGVQLAQPGVLNMNALMRQLQGMGYQLVQRPQVQRQAPIVQPIVQAGANIPVEPPIVAAQDADDAPAFQIAPNALEQLPPDGN